MRHRYVPRETILRVLAEEGMAVFSADDFRRRFRYRSASSQPRLGSLLRHGDVRRILHGWYVLRGPVEREVLREPMFLATHLVEPSYAAFGSAFHVHGWTDRAPRVTLVASPRRSRLRTVQRHPVEVVALPPRRFFGSAVARRGSLAFPVAAAEKAIVDAFYLPRRCGGLEAVVALLPRALPSLDLRRLEAYAVRMDDRALCSRLGYVLETLGVDSPALASHASRVHVRLDLRGPRRGRHSTRWNLILNV